MSSSNDATATAGVSTNTTRTETRGSSNKDATIETLPQDATGSAADDSNATNNKVSLVDITDLIASCAASLTTKEPFLCRKETFQLQDAMAATQLMDPKMDSCEIPASMVLGKTAAETETRTTISKSDDNPNKEDHQKIQNKKNDQTDRIMFPRPCPVSLSDPFVLLPWKELDMEQASAIVLHQLIRVQALFSGASVGESVFTCLYAHRPILCEMEQYFLNALLSSSNDSSSKKSAEVKLATDAIAVAFFEKGRADRLFSAQLSVFAATCAMLEITELFRSIVINADIYEEEDFVSNTHDIPFFLMPDKAILRQCMDTTVDILSHWLNLTNNNNDNDKKTTLQIQKLQLSLTFLNGLMVFCSNMGKLRQTGLPETVQSMQRLASSLGEGLRSLSDLINDSPKDNSAVVSSTIPESTFLAQVFDSYANRPMFGNTPVRKVCFRSPVESLSKLTELTEELDRAVCGLLVEGTSISKINHMLRRFCSCSILTRSLIVLNLYFDELLLGQHDLQALIIAQIREMEHLPTPLERNDHAQAFLSRLAKPIYDTMKLQVSNRNRQRAYMEVAMLQEWASLQSEANLVDTRYRLEYPAIVDNPNNNNNNKAIITEMPFFGHFVLSVLLRLMDQHLACGIEVGLFCGHDEICSVIWYRDFLLAALIQNLTQMKRSKDLHGGGGATTTQQQEPSIVQQPQPRTTDSPLKGKGKKKNHKNKSPNNNNIITKPTQQASSPQKSVEDLESGVELQVLEVQRMLCRGIVRFIVAIRQAGLFPFSEYEFTSRKKIFEKRFAVFESIQHPPLLTFDDYLEGSDGSNIAVHDLCQSASTIFRTCRVLVESILTQISNDSSINNNNNTATAGGRMVNFQTDGSPVQEIEARALLKVCVGNSVYLMKFSQLVNSHGGTLKHEKDQISAEFDFGAHKQFCIVKVS